MTGKEAIKILVLGEYSIHDIENVFNELVGEGTLPTGSETDRVEDMFKSMPFCYMGNWKGLSMHNAKPEDLPNLEQK